MGVPRVVLRIQSAERLRENYLKDLSEGGLFLKADRVLPIGSELTVELWPPGWTDSLALTARVVRVVEGPLESGKVPGMGVSFHDVAPETAAGLKQLLAEHGRPLEEVSLHDSDDPLEHVAELVRKLDEERARVGELTTQLLDARGENSAYQEQLQQVERLEGAQRELSERAQAEVDELRRRMEEEQVMTRRLQERVGVLEGELEELRGKETKLRNLLGKAGVGGGRSAAPRPSPPKAKEADFDRPATRPSPPAAPDVDPSDPFFELAVEDLEGSTPLAPPVEPPAEPVEALEVAFSDEALEQAFKEDEPLRGAQPPVAPMEADLAAFLEETEEVLEVDSDSIQEEPEIKTSIVDERLGYERFSSTLRSETRLMPSEKLATRAPASVDEALIAQFISASPTFSTLLNQVGGSMKEQRLRQLLYELYARGLVDVR